MVNRVIVVYSRRSRQNGTGRYGGGELPESRGSIGWPPRGGPPFMENMSYRQEKNKEVCDLEWADVMICTLELELAVSSGRCVSPTQLYVSSYLILTGSLRRV